MRRKARHTEIATVGRSVSGRLWYPEVRHAVASLEGTVSHDGNTLALSETAGPFSGSEIAGQMPDTGHISAVQRSSAFFFFFIALEPRVE